MFLTIRLSTIVFTIYNNWCPIIVWGDIFSFLCCLPPEFIPETLFSTLYSDTTSILKCKYAWKKHTKTDCIYSIMKSLAIHINILLKSYWICAPDSFLTFSSQLNCHVRIFSQVSLNYGTVVLIWVISNV